MNDCSFSRRENMGVIRLGLTENEVAKEPTVLFCLTLPRLWAVGSGVATLVAGAFTLGLFWQSHANELRVAQKDVDLARLKAKVEDLENMCPVARMKQAFFALDARLARKKKQAASSPSNKTLQQEVKDSEKKLASLLDENVNKLDANGTPVISVVLDDEE